MYQFPCIFFVGVFVLVDLAHVRRIVETDCDFFVPRVDKSGRTCEMRRILDCLENDR